MRACFRSKNLIGDALCISPALKAWHEEHKDWEIDLLTSPDHVADVYSHMGVPLKVVFDILDVEPETVKSRYDFIFDFDISVAFTLGEKKKIHVTQAFAELLQVDIVGGKLIYEPVEEEHERDLILISPSSKSCSSWSGKPPNKMLNWAVWAHVLPLLRQYGRVGVLGGPEDYIPMPVDDDEYYLGQPLNKVALMLRDARMLVAIDNGITHLAASQGTRTIEFYPACLGRHWIIPLGNPELIVYQMDPLELNVDTALVVVRQGLDRFFSGL